MNLIFNNWEIYLSKNFLSRVGYFLTFTLTGGWVGSSSMFIGGIFAGPPVPNLNLKILLCSATDSFNRCTAGFVRPFSAASLILLSSS